MPVLSINSELIILPELSVGLFSNNITVVSTTTPPTLKAKFTSVSEFFLIVIFFIICASYPT